MNFVPKNMTVDCLREGIYWLVERLYNEDAQLKRREPFFDELWRQREPAIPPPEIAEEFSGKKQTAPGR